MKESKGSTSVVAHHTSTCFCTLLWCWWKQVRFRKHNEREAVGALSQEVPKAGLDWPWVPWAGEGQPAHGRGWDCEGFNVPSNPSHFMDDNVKCRCYLKEVRQGHCAVTGAEKLTPASGCFLLKSCDFCLPDRSFQKKLLCVEYICLHVILIY